MNHFTKIIPVKKFLIAEQAYSRKVFDISITRNCLQTIRWIRFQNGKQYVEDTILIEDCFTCS